MVGDGDCGGSTELTDDAAEAPESPTADRDEGTASTTTRTTTKIAPNDKAANKP